MEIQIDRHNTYREVEGIFFPHHEDPRMPLRNSLIDGELVIDVDPRTRQVSTSTGTVLLASRTAEHGKL